MEEEWEVRVAVFLLLALGEYEVAQRLAAMGVA